MFMAVLIRKVSGLHIKKDQNGLEMCEWVGGWMILFRCNFDEDILV